MNSYVLFLVISLVSLIWATPIQQKRGPIPINETNARIIGGTVARTAQFPYVAALYLTKTDGQYFCGGAIISNLWILTAGHCVDGVSTFTIQLGSNSLQASDPNRVTLATSNSILHPLYNPFTYDNDVGLIKLHLEIVFNEHIRPISLTQLPLKELVPVTALGWGSTSDFAPGLADALNYVQLITVSNAECRVTYGTQITDNMVCATGNFNEGLCTGDSGSPLVQADSVGNPIHVGIGTFNSQNGCESVDPSGFTRTYQYHDWIRSMTGIN